MLFSFSLFLLTVKERERLCVRVSERKGNEEKHFLLLLLLLLFFIGFFFLSDSIIDQRSPIHSPSVIHHISPHILSRFIYTYCKWSAPLTHTLKSSLGARVHYISNDDRFNDTSRKINIFCTFDDFIKRKEIDVLLKMSVLFSIEWLMNLVFIFSCVPW